MKLLLIADNNNARDTLKLTSIMRSHTVVVPKRQGSAMLSTHARIARNKNCKAIICACVDTLRKLVAQTSTVDPYAKSVTLHNYKGSIYHINEFKVLIVDSLSNIFNMSHGRMMFQRHLNKLTGDFAAPSEPEFLYEEFEGNEQKLCRLAESALAIAVDIETIKYPIAEDDLEQYCKFRGVSHLGMAAHVKLKSTSKKLHNAIPLIDMVGYSLLLKAEDGTLYSKSFTVMMDSVANWQYVRRLNAMPAPKVLQNGGYDSTYFIRFGCPMNNWIYDTFHFMHAWYAEAPRDLGFISSLFLQKHMYWKNEIVTNRGEYCAKDVHGTLWAFIFMVNEAPDWVKSNYRIVFKKCFPNICAGLEGDLVDTEEQTNLFLKYDAKLEKARNRLGNICWAGFNSNSPKDVPAIFKTLSNVKYQKTDKIAMQKWRAESPLTNLVGELIQDVREARKAISTYINAPLFNGRLLYEINSSGTDTGRASSKASNLWVGTQRQNIDNALRSMYVADPGYEYCACDGSQAESRTTAYIAQELNLINAVETAPDFHTRNASMFFGMHENEITKALRNLGKRVNHGANYNMGAYVLLETMGSAKVVEAKKLLNFPSRMSLIQTCEKLLEIFDTTYPDLRGRYYDEVIKEITDTHKLTTPCDEIPWVRYCFDVPTRRKKVILNKYVASMPQGLSAHIIDAAWFDFWYKWQIQENCVRVKAAVHDEIQWQIKKGHPRMEEVDASAMELMSRPYTVHGRTMRIPADEVLHGHRLSEVKG